MPIDIDEYRKIKRDLDVARQEADKAKGAYESEMKRLAEGFDCKTIKQAEKLLKGMESEGETLAKEYNEKLAEFREKWKGKI